MHGRWQFAERHLHQYEDLSGMPRTGVGGVELTGTDELLEASGVKLPLMVYRPETKSPVPAVVICCGGQGTGMFEVMEWIGRSLQQAGILAVTISWRSSSPEFDVDDVSLAGDWLISQKDVDPDRIASSPGWAIRRSALTN
jgi:hypothetical protein